MVTNTLFDKLVELERSIGTAEPLWLRSMVMDAQAELLRMEREQVMLLLEMRALREECDIAPRPALCRYCPVCSGGAPEVPPAQA